MLSYVYAHTGSVLCILYLHLFINMLCVVVVSNFVCAQNKMSNCTCTEVGTLQDIYKFCEVSKEVCELQE